MSECIYCNSKEFKKVFLSNYFFIQCIKCKALYVDKKQIKNELKFQKECRESMYMFNG